MPLDGLDGLGGCLDIPFAIAIPDKPEGCVAVVVIAGLVIGLASIFQPQQPSPAPKPQVQAAPAPAPIPAPSIAPVQTQSRWKRLRNRAGDWMLRQGEEYIEDKLRERRERREREDQGK